MTLSLAVYGVLSQEVGATIEAADCELLARQERVIHFNGLLKKHCAELGVEYIDIFDEMTEGALLTTTCDLPLLATHHLLLATTCCLLLLTAPYHPLPPPYCLLRLLTASYRSPIPPLAAPHGLPGPEREHRVRPDFLDVSEPNIHPVWQHAQRTSSASPQPSSLLVAPWPPLGSPLAAPWLPLGRPLRSPRGAAVPRSARARA